MTVTLTLGSHTGNDRLNLFSWTKAFNNTGWGQFLQNSNDAHMYTVLW